MKRVFIAYGTSEGQTAKIADFISDVVRQHGHDPTVLDVKGAMEASLDGYDGVIIGASVHMGKHDEHVADFARRNLDTLSRVPSAFFSVSLAAHGDLADAQGYIELFEHETGWRPDKIALFGGALMYTQYGYIKRRLMKKIAGSKPGKLGTDMSRDYVYTEWDGVKRFAEDFAAALTDEGPSL
ncbi:flavodoxin domain-containing protein [Arthrobacter bambusae]|uniref:flavodoxin domain-containing protein n=1 Tax=Arthrobacter bambusae TaxID=1338426 RepID=UPI00278675EA|nr:flavodoxin domain-containing protein [Arthrobacter bambusae]MDQ0028690.1 menaquinone-dependent protoporphyrinogen oxidase [Arthrobacter bambusae]MDQ0096516.1 menaquinone-dependent protoporphyrinogen oxidase [Arthrobacter bambusae]